MENAFSLTEAMVATVIFTLAAAGLFATVRAFSIPASTSGREVFAAMHARGIIEDLRREVDAETWPAFSANGAYNWPQNIVIDGMSTNPTFTISADPAGTRAKQITVTITYEN